MSGTRDIRERDNDTGCEREMEREERKRGERGGRLRVECSHLPFPCSLSMRILLTTPFQLRKHLP